MTPDLSIYLVTDAGQAAAHGRSLLDTVEQAVAGGVTAVQVREKHTDARDVLELLEALAARLPDRVALMVNDRVDVFLAARSLDLPVTGVHVGQRDLPLEQARLLIGPEAVLGWSAGTAGQIAAAATSPARVDYVGIGTVRSTTSKADAPAPIGVSGVARLAASSTLPAVAIGGVVPGDLPTLRAGGLAGAAVVSWVCGSPDPYLSAAELAQSWAGAA
ncbi:MAG: thiamine phosphate synthase [Cellulomonadaceae bacterium]